MARSEQHLNTPVCDSVVELNGEGKEQGHGTVAMTDDGGLDDRGQSSRWNSGYVFALVGLNSEQMAHPNLDNSRAMCEPRDYLQRCGNRDAILPLVFCTFTLLTLW